MHTKCGIIWRMTTKIPPISEIKGRLESLSHAEILTLSKISTVPFTTIWKIRAGDTTNPGIETVRKFAQHFKRKPRTTHAAHGD
jgi:hypothetical protein